MKAEYVWTEDNLRLMGAHYPGQEICVLCIHGMAANIIENKFGVVCGEQLSAKNYGYLYAHNRGHSHINELARKPERKDHGYDSVQLGGTYELFTECIYDVKAWLNKVKALGYKKIILMGHSLGCNKSIYYISQNGEEEIAGLILASPPDLVGLVESNNYQPNHKELLTESKKYMEADQPRAILSGKLWDWAEKSAQNYLSLFSGSNEADNLPVNRNPERWEQLEKVTIPTLGVMGELEDIAIRTLPEDLKLIKSKATNCPDFQTEFIDGANHNYQNREKELAEVVINWLESVVK